MTLTGGDKFFTSGLGKLWAAATSSDELPRKDDTAFGLNCVSVSKLVVAGSSATGFSNESNSASFESFFPPFFFFLLISRQTVC